MEPKNEASKQVIIFFDGVCSFCNFWVRLILKLDKKEIFYFSPLQGEQAKVFLTCDLYKDPQTLVLLKNNTIHIKSSAVLEIITALPWPYRLLSAFSLLPTSLLDFFYSLIAKNRYLIFPKYTDCPIPEKRFLHRFLK